MFFRREKVKIPVFQDRLQALRASGFEVSTLADGKARVVKNGCAAIVEQVGAGEVRAGSEGVLVGSETGRLVDAGYQKFFLTPSGKKAAAQAGQLKALHEVQEDLKEALGLTSLYNESLGTTSEEHIYDRVQGRDAGKQPKPWEHTRH